MPKAEVGKIRGVYERVPKSGIWWIRFTGADGKLHREKVGRRSDAKTLIDKRRTETIQKEELPEKFRAKLTFKNLADDALVHSRVTNDAKVTQDFSPKIARMLPVFGSRDARTIKKNEFVDWLSKEAQARDWAASTRNRYQAAFSLIYRVGIENERIDKNPAAGIRRKTENNARVRFLSDDEEKRLRAVILKRLPGFIHQLDLSLHTGMRAGEQFSLRWSQVDLARRILTLPKTKNGTTRHIPLNSVALSALTQIRSSVSSGVSFADDDLVFPSARQESGLKSARGWFGSALADAKIKNYTWHCNRHTFASRLVMAGVDIRTVGELLGHKSLAMTMRYSHLAPAHNAAAVDRLVSTA
jgi:integrase